MTMGTFSFAYDDAFFDFQSLEPLPAVQSEGYQCTVNSMNPGLAAVSWTGSAPASTGRLFRLTLTAKENAVGTTAITCTPTNLRNAVPESIEASAITNSVTVTEKTAVADPPDFRLVGPAELNTNETISFAAVVEGRSAVAAADFAVFYDPAVLECVEAKSSTAEPEEVGEQMTVLVNNNAEKGKITINLLCDEGITQDTELAQLKFRAKENISADTVLQLSVSSPVDAALKPVTVNAVSASLAVVVPSFRVVFLAEDGTVLRDQMVPYLHGAVEPKIPEKSPTETVHYIPAWDTAFASVTGDLEVCAVYTAVAHNFEQWSAADDLQHSSACKDCSFVSLVEHSFVPWSQKDLVVHTRHCPVCDHTVEETHDWDAGAVTREPCSVRW